MKLSIVTCTYNSEKFLKQTLDSVASQKISRHILQHVILDGYSHDDTYSIANKYKEEMEWKIEVVIVQSPPNGIYNAFNEWIKNSNGEYILILPSDDFLEANVLEQYLDFIESTGSQDLYYAKRNTYNNEQKRNIGTAYPNKSLYFHGLNLFALGLSCYVSQPTVISRRDLHDRFGYYNENLRLVSDWEFYVKLTLWGAQGHFYDKVITNFRVHDGSATTGKMNPSNIGIDEEIHIFKTYYWYRKHFFIFLRKLYRILFY